MGRVVAVVDPIFATVTVRLEAFTLPPLANVAFTTMLLFSSRLSAFVTEIAVPCKLVELTVMVAVAVTAL